MNENLDLCKVLEGCEGVELYSTIFGVVNVVNIHEKFIDIKNTHDCYQQYNKDGKWTNIEDAECTIFPSKDQRDWSKFEKPIKEGTPMMCTDDSEKSICDDTSFIFARYSHTSRGVHYVKRDRCTYCYDVMIPFDKFDPNDIKGSLKHNIQK